MRQSLLNHGLLCIATCLFAATAPAIEVVVDNDSGAPNFNAPPYQETGFWQQSSSTGYNGGIYRFHQFDGTQATATWTPTIPEAGRYEVFYDFRNGTNRATYAPFEIKHAGGVDIVAISMYGPGAGAMTSTYLGEFDFDAGNDSYVKLDASGSGIFISDAVRFVTAVDDPPETLATLLIPESPNELQSPLLLAYIVDDDTVASATVVITSSPNGSPVMVPMYDDGLHGDFGADDYIWAATLPPQPSGDHVEYSIISEDIAGLQGTSLTYSYDVRDSSVDYPPEYQFSYYYPSFPTSSNFVTAIAYVLDDRPDLSVKVHYTSSPVGTSGTVDGFDDGLHEDGTAGDNYYGALLPRQPGGANVQFYFEFTDNGGHSVVSETHSYSVTSSGDNPPTIVSVERLIKNPDELDTVPVVAHVQDDIAVAAVSLLYRVNGGVEVLVEANDSGTSSDQLSGDGKWTAAIPPQAIGDLVSYNILAEDGIEQTTLSAGQNYTVRDSSINYPPVFADISHLPEVVLETDTAIVTASVEDDDGLTSTALVYSTGGDPVTIPMFDDGLHSDGAAGDGVWAAEVPAQAADTIVNYYIAATDALGLVAQSGPTQYTVLSLIGPPQYRALWVDSWNASFLNPAQAEDLVNQVRAANINTIVIEVRKVGDAYYNSSYEPRANNITGGDDYDPLQYLIDLCHDTTEGKQRIDVHGWFVMHRIAVGNYLPGHILQTHPEYIMQTNTGEVYGGTSRYLDPGHPGTVDHNIKVILDCMEKYDIDGVNMDYVRYPEYTGEWGYNPVSVQRFNSFTGGDGSPNPDSAAWDAWRRECVTLEVKKLYVEMMKLKPHVVLSADTVNWGFSYSNFETSEAYRSVFQDWRGWLQEGIIDYNMLMNYSGEHSYPGRFNSWTDVSLAYDDIRGSIIGNGAYLQRSNQVTVNQLKYALDNGAAGVAIYDWGSEINANNQGESRADFYNLLAGTIFRRKAEVPATPWKDNPTKGVIEGVVSYYGTPVDHALVTLGDRTTYTDGAGWYGFLELDPGEHQITAALVSGHSKTVSDTLALAGDVLTVNIDITLAGVPVVAITSPSENQKFSALVTDVLFEGTATDDDANFELVQYRINGGEWHDGPTTDTWSVTLQGFIPGSNLVEFRARDTAENIGPTASRTILVNRAPVLNVSAQNPPGVLPNSQTSVTFTGTASDGDNDLASVTYQVGSAGPVQNATGINSWSFTAIGLAIGQNQVHITATDEFGDKAIEIRQVLRNALPEVEITGGAGPISTYETALLLSGTTKDDDGTVNTVQVRLNGAAWQNAAGNESWSAQINDLVLGDNTVDVRAIDDRGDEGLASITIVRQEDLAPTIIVSSPADESMRAPADQESIMIEGTVDDPEDGMTTVHYKVGDSDWSSIENVESEWSFNLPLAVGNNDLSIYATDERGNDSATLSRSITRLASEPDDLYALTPFGDIWWSENRLGTYQPPVRLDFMGFHHDAATSWQTVAADFNGDGLTDFATINEFNELWVAYNVNNQSLDGSHKLSTTGWSYNPSQGSIAFAVDLEEDGFAEVFQSLLHSNDMVLWNSAAGWENQVIAGGEIQFDPANGSWAGVGRMASSNGLGLVQALPASNAHTIFGWNFSRGSSGLVRRGVTDAFAYDPSNGAIPVIGHFTNTANDDILLFNADSAQVAITNGSTDFSSVAEWGTNTFKVDINSGEGWWLFAGDADGDGLDDLIQLNEFGEIWVATSNGIDGFNAPVKNAALGFHHQPGGPWQMFVERQ